MIALGRQHDSSQVIIICIFIGYLHACRTCEIKKELFCYIDVQWNVTRMNILPCNKKVAILLCDNVGYIFI